VSNVREMPSSERDEPAGLSQARWVDEEHPRSVEVVQVTRILCTTADKGGSAAYRLEFPANVLIEQGHDITIDYFGKSIYAETDEGFNVTHVRKLDYDVVILHRPKPAQSSVRRTGTTTTRRGRGENLRCPALVRL
jgi:hypothetical protein